MLAPSELDQYDHAPDDQKICGASSDQDLEDEDVRHDKTYDCLLPKPESMIAGPAKKRDAKHDQKHQNEDNKLSTRHSLAESRVVTATKYVLVSQVKNTVAVSTQYDPP